MSANQSGPSWWNGLTTGGKAAIITAGFLSVMLCCGGFNSLVASFSSPEPKTTSAAETSATEASPSPVVEKRTVAETEEIPFPHEEVEDASLLEGKREVRTEGVAGTKELVYEVTLVNGVETSRTLVSEEVTEEPVPEVIAIGTRKETEPLQAPQPKPQRAPDPKPEQAPAPKSTPKRAPAPEPTCDPNYAGACVPIASDVDCAGGSGDGPAYVQGPVRVIGRDIYGLDRDGDGIGCD